MKNINTTLIITLFIVLFKPVFSTEVDTLKNNKIYVFEIKEEISPPAFFKTKKAFREADSLNADLIIIHMNTYGGLVDVADSIRTKILNSTIPVYVFIDNNAASAGSLISIACDRIYMRKGANIGAATVVNQSGEVVPDKYQSYMRSMMRSTAEAKGRDPQIAEAMVDPSVYIENVIDSGKVLTFTTTEAIANGFCEGETETIEELLQMAGIKEYEIIEQKLTATDMIIRFFTNPMLSGLLIMVIIGGIYFELQTPGIGFPLAASVIAALLYFAPHYIEGLAAHWEILVFIIGVLLIGVEIFALPGFGVTGVAGIILIVTSLSLSMLRNDGLNFDGIGADAMATSFFTVIIAAFLSLITSFYLSKKLFTSTRFGALALDTVQNKDDGFTSAENRMQNMKGKVGYVHTMLRPSGTVIIDEETYDAVALTSYIDKGEKIVVLKYENMQLTVRKLDSN